MSEIDLSDKYPEIEPISSSPSLFTFNGCGLSLYGSRDRDEESGVHVKTHVVTLVFLPIICLRSYVVANAEQGWYFLGRVPLSGFARAFNALVLAGLFTAVAAIGWQSHTLSPDYRAGRMMADAAQLESQGSLPGAVELWRRVVDLRAAHAADAEARIAAALAQSADAGRPGELARLIGTISAISHPAAKERLADGLVVRGTQVLDAHQEEQPGGSLDLLDALLPLAPAASELEARRRPLLERVVQAEPENVDAASKLAVLLEAEEAMAGLEALLAPHADQLGSREGARILGQIYAADGRLDASRNLLLPYTEGRLATLRRAEAAYEQKIQAAWQRELDNLNEGDAARDWYQRYDRAGEAEQEQMVHDWVGSRLREDRQLARAEEEISRAAAIVPVALDLGMIMVQRAHGLAGETRRQELEAAEKIFLGIQGMAGESDQFRLSLGQVYYWLGRPDEGEALFEQLLSSYERAPEWLLHVGHVARAVGAETKARQLAEEAYESSTVEDEKYRAASLCAILESEPVEKVTWYERADPALPETRASLAASRGQVARLAGRRGEAIRHYREALATYGTMVESASTLNNAALVHFQIFETSGETPSFHDGARMMERALALMPQDSIVMSNVASVLTQAALLDVIGDAVDLAALQSGADTSLLSFLYADASGRAEVYRRFRRHESAVKAKELWQKMLVLAPKGAEAYLSLITLGFEHEDEAETLRQLQARLQVTPADVDENIDQARRYWNGEEDELRRERAQAFVERYRPVVEATRGGDDVTFAIAAARLSSGLLASSWLGLEVDLDEAVRLAEEAHTARPSVATVSALQQALLLRGTLRLASQRPAWAAWLEAGRNSLDSDDLVIWMLAKGGAAADAAAADVDITRAVELSVADAALFPESASPWEWALVRHSRPQLAAELEARLRRDEARRLRTELRALLRPASSSYVLRASWQRRMLGEAEALAPVRALSELGAELPKPFLEG